MAHRDAGRRSPNTGAGGDAGPARRLFRRIRQRGTGLLIFVALATIQAPAGFAFHADGHRIVAELAQRQLSPAARRDVARLLAEEPEPTLAGVATWADDFRETPEGRWTAPLHYVNFPRASCRYDAGRDCPRGRCIVGAIERYAGILVDRSKPDDVRRQALKFLVHFVGDIHQPLHAGYADDRGGNNFQVFYIGRGSNLHALWDGGILRQAHRDWHDYVAQLARADRVDRIQARWSDEAPQAWAEASCRLIESAAIYPRRPGRLEPGYADRQRPLIERQLVLAAVRLAAVLEASLARARAR